MAHDNAVAATVSRVTHVAGFMLQTMDSGWQERNERLPHQSKILSQKQSLRNLMESTALIYC